MNKNLYRCIGNLNAVYIVTKTNEKPFYSPNQNQNLYFST